MLLQHILEPLQKTLLWCEGTNQCKYTVHVGVMNLSVTQFWVCCFREYVYVYFQHFYYFDFFIRYNRNVAVMDTRNKLQRCWRSERVVLCSDCSTCTGTALWTRVSSLITMDDHNYFFVLLHVPCHTRYDNSLCVCVCINSAAACLLSINALHIFTHSFLIYKLMARLL